MDEPEDARERAVVAIVTNGRRSSDAADDGLDPEASLDELTELTDTAGAEVVGRIIQRRDHPSASHYLGRGRVDEPAAAGSRGEVDLLICDDELRPIQQRNLERDTGLRVIDRTQLILDIFAQRARTHEGRLQVELAQLHYLLPRLVGSNRALSRLGGGIGTRGPGESRLEQDRRRIKERITSLNRQLEDVRRTRTEQRRRRVASGISTVALVGYTNAGKSTILHALSGADVFVEDRLFATLDPTTRRVRLADGRRVLLTDTVGFIRKLPHTLVAAFRATLEEVNEADLLVHVLDVSHPDYPAHYRAVREVLTELGAADKPSVTALNKSDLLSPFDVRPPAVEDAGPAVTLSAETGQGVDALLETIEAALSDETVFAQLQIPYDQGVWLHNLHEQARIVGKEYGPTGVSVQAEVERKLLGQFRPFLQGEYHTSE